MRGEAAIRSCSMESKMRGCCFPETSSGVTIVDKRDVEAE